MEAYGHGGTSDGGMSKGVLVWCSVWCFVLLGLWPLGVGLGQVVELEVKGGGGGLGLVFPGGRRFFVQY